MKRAILILISLFLALTCSRMLSWSPDGTLLTHSYSIWGDWSAHFSFISNLQQRGFEWLFDENPLFAGIPFQYPFLSHVITAIFGSITGLDVPKATLFSTILLLLALPFGLDRFYRSIGLTSRQSIFAVLLFLFIGGLQAFDSSLNPQDPLTNQMESGSIFTQFVLFELIPQRAFLFGMVMFLFSISALVNRKLNRKKVILIGCLMALLAWTHLHTWLAMGTVLLAAFLHSLWTGRSVRERLLFGAGVAFLSLPLIYLLLFKIGPSADAQSAISTWNKWFPGWAQNPNSGKTVAQNMNFFVFWIYNTGIFLPLTVWGTWTFWKSRGHQSKPDVCTVGYSGLLLAVIALLFNLQPYFYDNLKTFTYAFLFLAPLAAIGVDYFFESKKRIFWIMGGILLMIQCWTGFQDHLFYLEQKHGTVFFNTNEFNLAKKFQSERKSADSLVAISPRHNHWVPTLAGNPVFMGYPGWLWTWGINFGFREADLNRILLFQDPEQAKSILRKYQIEYLVIHDGDQAAGRPVPVSALKEHFPALIEENGWHILKTNL